LWLLATTVGPVSDASVNDLFVYRSYAHALAHGAGAYTDLGLEYPPLALIPIRLGGVLGTGETAYAWVFGALMLAAALAVQLLAARLAGARARRVAWLVALLPVVAGAMVRTHFDLVPLALLLAALLAFAQQRPTLGGALLGAGAMTKLFPAIVLPVAIAWLLGRREARAALRAGAAFVAVVVVVSAPFLSSSYLDAYRFHLDRPVQIESTPATVLFALGGSHVTGAPVRPDRFKSNGLAGGSAGAVDAFFVVLLVVAVALVAVRAAERPDPRRLVMCAFAALLAFAALGKVLSPQFMIWLVPFAALAWVWGLRVPAALSAAAVAATQLWFPGRYFDLVARDGGVIVLVALRNALLLAALTTLLVRLAAPARSRRLAAAPTP
jgi:Glycosyltransferase family 87